MKKFLPMLLAMSVFFVSCAAIAAAEQEAEKEGAEFAQSAIDTGDISIEVQNIISQYGPAVHSNGEYWLTIKDGKVSSSLPFFGTSTYAAYGSSDGGIKFDNCPVQVSVLKSRLSKGEHKWAFIGKTEREEVEVVITFFDNGSASIHCNSRTRSPMNYNGHLKKVE